MQIYILKSFQNSGVWFHVGIGYEVDDLRAKDLIDAGLATDKNPRTVELKPRQATQAKLRQAASTKTVAVVEPIKLVDDSTDNPQGDPSADLLEQNADQQTADNNNDQG